jgi:hypothetical protein
MVVKRKVSQPTSCQGHSDSGQQTFNSRHLEEGSSMMMSAVRCSLSLCPWPLVGCETSQFSKHFTRDETGAGLILALIISALLSMLVGAMLTAVTVDVWIGNNYRTESQLVHLTEAGIEDARETMRSEPITPSSDPFIERKPLLDTTGKEAGRYSVTLVRSNPLTLRSRGEVGSARRTIEVRLRKSGFPSPFEAITLNEDVPLPDGMDPRLTTTGGLEETVEAITRHATDVYRPALGETENLGPIGSLSDYRVVVVEGNAALGNATGHGLLLVRGELELYGTVSWNGLILVIGQGVMRASISTTAGISGAVFLSRTRADDRSAVNPLGTLLQQRGIVTFDLPVGSTSISWSPEQIERANGRFPYVLTTWREY